MSGIVESNIKNRNKARFVHDDGEWWYILAPAKGQKGVVRTRAVIGICFACGERYLTLPQRFKRGGQQGRFCSRECGTKTRGGHPGKRGPKSHRWKGGRRIDHRGYVLIFKPDYPGRKTHGKYVMEHRLVMEGVMGRFLEQTEHVHHKNGIKDDNRPENLELWSGAHPYGVRWKDVPEPVKVLVDYLTGKGGLPPEVVEAIRRLRTIVNLN